MCIRDRDGMRVNSGDVKATIEAIIADKNLNLKEAGYKNIKEIKIVSETESVSYTHLDVYKRQGNDLVRMKNSQMLKYRKEIQIIFQDPYASLSPRMTIGDIVNEPLEIHRIGSKISRLKRIKEYLGTVGLNPEHINRYPHEFSGGQRQRVGIARALVLQPELVICDEPVSALDVSVQAQILNLMLDLQSEFNLTYLFIAHDLSVVKYVSNRIGVMYLGKIVEVAPSEKLYINPLHPYTMGLLSAIPIPDPEIERKRQRIILPTPGHAKIVSVKIAPPIKVPKSIPI